VNQRAGLKPIAGPAHFRVLVHDGQALPGAKVSQAHYLHASERAFYELPGTIWAKLRGQV
jgi:hypothetical protein